MQITENQIALLVEASGSAHRPQPVTPLPVQSAGRRSSFSSHVEHALSLFSPMHDVTVAVHSVLTSRLSPDQHCVHLPPAPF